MSKPQTQLGQIITNDEQQRDAVHIAVAPVVSEQKLYPGQDIGLVPNTTDCVCPAGYARDLELIGIVDPFLKEAIYPGQRFWMFLYPNTITSLNRVWTHPSFEEPIVIEVQEEFPVTHGARMETKVDSDSQPASEVWVRRNRDVSESWLRDFAARSDCPDYDTLIAAATGRGDRQFSDEYLHFNDRDAHGEIPPEFWDHIEVVTGHKRIHRPTYFSCSC